jgi:hypothetical protein
MSRVRVKRRVVEKATYVRFGSLADICAAQRDVRFTPNSDRESGLSQQVMSALHLKADMCGAVAEVCCGPYADNKLLRLLAVYWQGSTSGAVAGLPVPNRRPKIKFHTQDRTQLFNRIGFGQVAGILHKESDHAVSHALARGVKHFQIWSNLNGFDSERYASFGISL